MSQQTDEELSLRRYLLAEMEEVERERVEERLFTDENFADELEQAESRLIDDYAFNALTPQEREKFERNFIFNDERRKNLLFARAMDSYLDERSGNKLWSLIKTHRVLAGATAAAIILLAIVGLGAVRWLRKNEQVNQMHARSERINRLVTELNRRPFSLQALPGVDLLLQPTHLRGDSEMEQVQIDKDVKVLNLKLALVTDQSPRYSVDVMPVGGSKLFSVNDLLPEQDQGRSSVLVRIPTEVLTTNDYQLDLNGIAANGQISTTRFNLRVINRTSLQP